MGFCIYNESIAIQGCILKKIVYIDTTYPINSRTQRFFSSSKNVLDSRVIAWNRSEKKVKSNDFEMILNTNARYGNKFQKLLNLPIFFIFLFKRLKNNKPDYVFASHWDSLFLVSIVKFIGRQEYKIIYDCLDLPTTNNKILLYFIRLIENLCLKNTSLIILASRYFERFYTDHDNFIFENYPSEKLIKFGSINNAENKIALPNHTSKKHVLGWIGVVRYKKVIFNILEALREVDCYFYVFGDGPDLEIIKEKVAMLGLQNQVFFFGRYEMHDLPYIYSLCDLVWAAYPTDDFNAVYAISNKYFECSYYNKIPIISSKTEMVRNSTSDFIISVDEYDIDDIIVKIRQGISKCVLPFMKYEIDSFWEEHEVEFLRKVKEL